MASGETAGGAVLGLALLAGTIEVMTMLPYLGAIGILSSTDMSWWRSLAVLGGYCVVMVAPALLILAGRVVFGSYVEPKLAAFERWVSKYFASSTGWILGIVGFLVARDAAWRLGLLDQLLGG